MAVLYEYIVSGPVSSSLSHPSVAHQCIACTIALSNRSNHATVHPAGSTSHEAVNCSPHTVGPGHIRHVPGRSAGPTRVLPDQAETSRNSDRRSRNSDRQPCGELSAGKNRVTNLSEHKVIVWWKYDPASTWISKSIVTENLRARNLSEHKVIVW